MSKKLVDEEHSKEALKQMIVDRKHGEAVGEVLAVFCERYGLNMAACRRIYNELVAKGEVKEKPL